MSEDELPRFRDEDDVNLSKCTTLELARELQRRLEDLKILDEVQGRDVFEDMIDLLAGEVDDEEEEA